LLPTGLGGWAGDGDDSRWTIYSKNYNVNFFSQRVVDELKNIWGNKVREEAGHSETIVRIRGGESGKRSKIALTTNLGLL
jgi:hypothetical protein